MNKLNLSVIGLLLAAIVFTGCSKDDAGNGSDVYVTGYEGTVAKLWKNGVAQNLFSESSLRSSGEHKAEANSVYVSGNDTYVAGYERDFKSSDE